jgi:hypothetical protein
MWAKGPMVFNHRIDSFRSMMDTSSLAEIVHIIRKRRRCTIAGDARRLNGVRWSHMPARRTEGGHARASIETSTRRHHWPFSPEGTRPRSTLIVGHPGHELRVHGWLELARPITMVLTDGSGHTGRSRLPSTAAVLARAGAQAGPVFGRFTDQGLYRALLERDLPVFVGIAEELTATLVSEHIDLVAGDDAEGYNPTHDVCRMIINAAVARARSVAGVSIENLAFALMDQPGVTATPASETAALRLDADALARKLGAADTYEEMKGEVEAARTAWGDAAFAVETFRRVPDHETGVSADELPFYERHGARRVGEGLYAEVIRFDRHIRPLAEALGAYARPSLTCTSSSPT